MYAQIDTSPWHRWLNISQQQVINPSDYCLVLRKKTTKNYKNSERKSTTAHLLSSLKGHKFNGWDHHRWSPVKHGDFLNQSADSWQ